MRMFRNGKRTLLYADAPSVMPPTPMMGTLPSVRAYMSNSTRLLCASSGLPLSPPVSPRCADWSPSRLMVVLEMMIPSVERGKDGGGGDVGECPDGAASPLRHLPMPTRVTTAAMSSRSSLLEHVIGV